MVVYPTGSEKEFNEFLVREYLKHGSVDEVLKRHKFDLPISYASYQRVLDKWGIVKAAGPNNTLGEMLDFVTKFAQERLPVEKLYKKMPSSFKTSAATLYRILSYIKEGVTRRMGTALVITNDREDRVLIAEDITHTRLDYGKGFGAHTIPMSFSKLSDLRENAILRVLQSEVYADLAVEKKLNKKLFNFPKEPFVYIDMADVRVEVYHIQLSKTLQEEKFSSYKLKNHKFILLDELLHKKNNYLRMGVKEALNAYKKMIVFEKKDMVYNTMIVKAGENFEIANGES